MSGAEKHRPEGSGPLPRTSSPVPKASRPVPETSHPVSNETRPFPEDLKRFTKAERWTFAKTMPEWPHEYLVRGRVDEELFVRLVTHIRANGYDGSFYEKPIRYYDEDGWVYWTMGAPIDATTIINRCRKEQSFEYRAAHGSLPRRASDPTTL